MPVVLTVPWSVSPSSPGSVLFASAPQCAGSTVDQGGRRPRVAGVSGQRLRLVQGPPAFGCEGRCAIVGRPIGPHIEQMPFRSGSVLKRCDFPEPPVADAALPVGGEAARPSG